MTQASTVLDKTTYDRIRRIVHAKSGITLNDSKATLVTARLSKRIRTLGLPSYKAYLDHLEADASGNELTRFLDAISTNVTYFFREPDHFEFIQEVFRSWLQTGQKRVRIWSAACSTGEEPYSLGMALAEQMTPELDVRILATDISTQALAKAMRGVYSEHATEPIPAALRSLHLKSAKTSEGMGHAVGKHIAENILFRQLNLIEHPIPLQGPLDLILCRNVMIYFDRATRQKLVSEFYRLVKPGGYLIVSHSESLIGVRAGFEMLRPSVYLKPAARERTTAS